MYIYNPLHSNLVQFKHDLFTEWEESGIGFTFQSGTIQALFTEKRNRPEPGFTFQSGTIQAVTSGSRQTILTIFTFQSGTIQAAGPVQESDSDYALHSNLVQFKLIQPRLLLQFLTPLHSNLVQFKQCREWLGRHGDRLYIPIWYNSSALEAA